MYVQRLAILVLTLLRFTLSMVGATPADEAIASTKDASNDSEAASLPMVVAERLVRLRRHPLTIIKHISRASHKRYKPRRRIKRPKVTYIAAPSYSYSPSLTYYKSRKRPKLTAVDDIQHLSYDAEYELPPSPSSSSYESQVMDLDFYSHGDESSDSKYQSFEVEEPTYESSYEGPPTKKHGGTVRAPHKSYGVPTKHEYANDYHSEEDQGYVHSSSGGSYELKHEYEHRPDPPLPPQPPTTAYGVSASGHDTYVPPPLPKPHPPQTPSSGTYAVYEKKLPNTGYAPKQHFAEPPPSYTHEESGGGGNIEISYSPPAYEINLPPTQSGDEHPPVEHPAINGGHFAEPPAQTAPAQEVPTYHAPPSQPHPNVPTPTQPAQPPKHRPGSIQDYLPPKKELPLNPNHKQPAYDFPKTSYEVPIYDPIPFDASSLDQRELYPPHPYDILHQPPPNVVRDTDAGRHNTEVIQYESNEAVDVPEVPHDERHVSGSSFNEATQKPPKRKRRQRKRKRVHGSTTVAATSTKHILDTPELEAAFHANSHHQREVHYHDDHDADGHESSFVEEKQTTVRGRTALPYPNHEGYVSQAWNPMRLRTPASIGVATTTRATTLSQHIAATASTPQRKRPYQRSPRPVATASTPPYAAKPPSGKTMTIVTIEKSRSQDFHEHSNTTPPSVQPHEVAVQRTRPSRIRKPTRPAHEATHSSTAPEKTPPTTTKRTTKSIFETTYFKTPTRFNSELQQQLSAYEFNLPKNHRPY